MIFIAAPVNQHLPSRLTTLQSVDIPTGAARVRLVDVERVELLQLGVGELDAHSLVVGLDASWVAALRHDPDRLVDRPREKNLHNKTKLSKQPGQVQPYGCWQY